MAVITTGNHPRALWPGVAAWFGRAYNEYQPQYVDWVSVETSDKNYEEKAESTGFGLAQIKGQGESINYQTDSQGVTARWTHVVYGSGYIVTEEELDDNLYEEVSRRRAPDLAYALRQTKENVVALKFNRAFTAGAYAGADGVAMISLSHPTIAGNQSNRLTTDADLSETAIEDLVTQIRQATNARGLAIQLQPVSLNIPVALEFEANRILNSVLQNDTANNAVNVIRMMGLFPKGIKCNRYLSSSTAWFIQTDARHGVSLMQRKAVKFVRDSDFDTSNAKSKASERYSLNHGEWRHYFGSPGV